MSFVCILNPLLCADFLISPRLLYVYVLSIDRYLYITYTPIDYYLNMLIKYYL